MTESSWQKLMERNQKLHMTLSEIIKKLDKENHDLEKTINILLRGNNGKNKDDKPRKRLRSSRNK